MTDHVYMMVTGDELELPLICTDTANEMERRTGIKKNSIFKSIARASKRNGSGIKFVKVDFEEEEEE